MFQIGEMAAQKTTYRTEPCHLVELLQAGRLENPELELSYADDFAFNAEGERSGSVEFSQSFPVTARLAREKDVAGKDVAIAEAEIRDFVRNLVAEVQSAFYSVRSLDEQLGVTHELVASVRDALHRESFEGWTALAEGLREWPLWRSGSTPKPAG